MAASEVASSFRTILPKRWSKDTAEKGGQRSKDTAEKGVHWSKDTAENGSQRSKDSAEKGGSLCPDLIRELEPCSSELDDTNMQRESIGGTVCWPECIAEVLPANPDCKSCTSCAYAACGSQDSSTKQRPMTISVEVLALVVLEDGFSVLPPPRETALWDPRTWFTWRPVVEMVGAGPVITTLEGRPAAPGPQSPQKSGEGHWVGLVFPGSPEGAATVLVSSAGMLRFRVLRSRSALGSRDLEQVFKANLDMGRDYCTHGYPERLIRPVYWCSDAGDIRHVGHLHIRIRQFGNTGRKGQPNAGGRAIRKQAMAATPSRAAKIARVPQDYQTLQAAVDTLLPASPGDCRVVIGAGTHNCGTLYIRKPLILEGCDNGTAVVEGNIIIESGGESAEIRRLQLCGSLAVRAGTPVVKNCTVFESGSKAPAAGLARGIIVGGINVSGRGVKPHVEGNIISRGVGPGILVHDSASGVFRKNKVIGNEASGIEVRDAGTLPVVESNQLLENMHNGLYVHKNAGGTFRNNDIHRNMRCGISVSGDGSGCMPVISGNRVHENEQGGIRVEGPLHNAITDNEELGPARPPQKTKVKDRSG